MELTPELAKTMLGFSIVIIDVLGSGNAPLGVVGILNYSTNASFIVWNGTESLTVDNLPEAVSA
jgi:hypothetical protein